MNAHDDDLPSVAMDDEFRGRENKGPKQAKHEPRFTPEDDMPAVNRKKTNSTLSNMIMLLFVLGAGLALIYSVNSGDKKAKEPAPKKQEAMATNNLPEIKELAIPPPPPPPPAPATPQQVGPVSVANTPGGVVSYAGAGTGVQRGPNGKPPMHWTDRKLAGDLVVQSGGSQGGASQPPRGGAVPDYSKLQALQTGQTGSAAGISLPGAGASSREGLATRLTATEMVGVSASLLPDRNFIITKGTSLDCALETAIDTTLPGIITCRLTRDVYSDNGQVLLMDRGTQFVGEQQGNVKQGQARVFALWSRAKTPNGVIINLNSPGADALGRSGLEGWVDNHFADRFGAAILMSFIQTTLDVIADKNSDKGYQGAYVNEASDGTGKIIEKILDSTINIPPTIIKNQGDHINIMVARDLDFSGVYGLETE